MPSVTPPLLIEHSRKIGQQSASQTLKAIAKAYPGKLFGTLSLVGLENALLLAYPLFAGFAVDAMLRGDAGNALKLYEQVADQGYQGQIQSRVMVGPFADRAAAEKARQALRRAGVGQGVLVPPEHSK